MCSSKVSNTLLHLSRQLFVIWNMVLMLVLAFYLTRHGILSFSSWNNYHSEWVYNNFFMLTLLGFMPILFILLVYVDKYIALKLKLIMSLSVLYTVFMFLFIVATAFASMYILMFSVVVLLVGLMVMLLYQIMDLLYDYLMESQLMKNYLIRRYWFKRVSIRKSIKITGKVKLLHPNTYIMTSSRGYSTSSDERELFTYVFNYETRRVESINSCSCGLSEKKMRYVLSEANHFHVVIYIGSELKDKLLEHGITEGSYFSPVHDIHSRHDGGIGLVWSTHTTLYLDRPGNEKYRKLVGGDSHMGEVVSLKRYSFNSLKGPLFSPKNELTKEHKSVLCDLYLGKDTDIYRNQYPWNNIMVLGAFRPKCETPSITHVSRWTIPLMELEGSRYLK